VCDRVPQARRLGHSSELFRQPQISKLYFVYTSIFIILDKNIVTTKVAKVGMALMGSNYVALNFRNVVPEVQRAVHKKYLIGLLVEN
jgi:hypothetical protein